MKLERFTFNGGEVHVKVADVLRLPIYHLTHHIRNSDDIMALLLITDALRRSGNQSIALTMPYIPYARQDRVMVEGEPLSIKVFCDLLNSQNYASVTVWDPHSDVSTALINRCQVVTQEDIVSSNIGPMNITSDTILVCPDAGARKKTMKVAQVVGVKDIAFADKVRDVTTGLITGTIIHLNPFVNFGDRDVLIVDDLCDGGYTFVELAKALREAGAKGRIKLYVTHGIFSKGLDVFNGLIDDVFTANPWPGVESPILHKLII